MLRGQICDDGKRGNASPSDVNSWFILKATAFGSNAADEQGKIIGWASWLHEVPGGSDETATATPQTQDNERVPQEKDKRSLMSMPHGLGALYRVHQARHYETWYQQHLPQTSPHEPSTTPQGLLSLRACFVLPAFQRLGVGGALVREGCARADRLGLNTLVSSTEVGRRLYEREGDFEAFGDVKFALREFRGRKNGKGDGNGKGQKESEEEVEGERWYRFWFMARIFRPVG